MFTNKNFGNMMLAHHVNPNAPAGDIPNTEPSLENMVDMVLSGEMPKEYLGDNPDRTIQKVLDKRSRKPIPTIQVNPKNYKMPSEFPGTIEEFNKLYPDEKEIDDRPEFMEIPVIPFLQSYIENNLNNKMG